MWFTPAGGNCDGDPSFSTWTANPQAEKWGLTWCKSCSETKWSLGIGRGGPGWYPTVKSQQGRVGRWFCGCGFSKDYNSNQGSGGEGLKGPPWFAKFDKPVGVGCCYKLTAVNRIGTYGSRIYPLVHKWLIPPFKTVNHNAGWLYGGETNNFNRIGDKIIDPDYCGDNCPNMPPPC